MFRNHLITRFCHGHSKAYIPSKCAKTYSPVKTGVVKDIPIVNSHLSDIRYINCMNKLTIISTNVDTLFAITCLTFTVNLVSLILQ